MGKRTGTIKVQVQQTPARIYERLDVTFEMLPSVNRMHGINTRATQGQRMYTPEWVKKFQQEADKTLKEQVALSGWKVSKNDRYLLIADLRFYLEDAEVKTGESRQDLHNPWKPMVDCLARAGVIANDKYERHETLTKILVRNPLETQTTITVCKFAAEVYPFDLPLRETMLGLLELLGYTEIDKTPRTEREKSA